MFVALLALVAAAGDPAATAPPASAPPAAQPAQAPAGKKAPAERRPLIPSASLPTVEGDVVAMDHKAHRLRLKVGDGEIVLDYDRNTLVRGPGGAITPLELTPGARVRAGRAGEARASWIEVKPAPSTPGTPP